MARKKSSHPPVIKAALIIIFILITALAAIGLSQTNLDFKNQAKEFSPPQAVATPNTVSGAVINVGVARPPTCPVNGFPGVLGHNVILTNLDSGDQVKTVTGPGPFGDGYFEFTDVQNGKYELCSIGKNDTLQHYCVTQYQGGDPFLEECSQFKIDDSGVNNVIFALKNPIPTPSEAVKRVFITSTSYTANLGGLTGADLKCQSRADAANLGGIWKAWISDSTTSASQRLNHFNGPYVGMTGVRLANNWSDLVDGTLNTVFSVTEYGLSRWSQPFSFTAPDGSIDQRNPTYHCSNWTMASHVAGAAGNAHMLNYEWTAGNNVWCDSSQGIYCIEQ